MVTATATTTATATATAMGGASLAHCTSPENSPAKAEGHVLVSTKALRQTILLPAGNARGPVPPSSVSSATSGLLAVDDNVGKLRKSSLAKSSHDYFR